MLGFDDGSEQTRTLDGTHTETINADLTGSVDLADATMLDENKLIQFEGTKKGAHFDIPSDMARAMLDAPLNPNGRPNADVVRPWVNGLDITRRPRNMWVIDFGTHMSAEDASLYELPLEYVRTHVEPKYGATRKNFYHNTSISGQR